MPKEKDVNTELAEFRLTIEEATEQYGDYWQTEEPTRKRLRWEQLTTGQKVSYHHVRLSRPVPVEVAYLRTDRNNQYVGLTPDPYNGSSQPLEVSAAELGMRPFYVLPIWCHWQWLTRRA